MDKKKIRVSRLRALVDADGGPAEFARKRSQEDQDKAIDPTYVSQLLNEHRSFGEKAAANMARRAGLPPDYFDKEDRPISADRSIEPQERMKKIISALSAATDDQIRRVEEMIPILLPDLQAEPDKRRANGWQQ